MSQPTLQTPPPGAPAPQPKRTLRVVCEDTHVEVVNDPFSDRLRCDHPKLAAAPALAEALLETAEELGRTRVVALVDSAIVPSFADAGFEVEAIMPGFYGGERDCAVVGAALGDHRMELAAPRQLERTEEILDAKKGTPGLHVAVSSDVASVDDASAIAALLDSTFVDYPTPTEASYVASQIADGNVFRVVRDGDEIVSCASADLVPEAQTAELTDCATRLTHRGGGLMRAILTDLLDDLRAMDYATAFTLARAAIPGVNVAFQRCGFELRGTMAQSCRIGDGLEDMNVWSRSLQIG